MKRIISFFIIIILVLLSGCVKQEKIEDTKEITKTEEIRGVWLFYRELSMESENGGTEESFTEKINDIFDNCVSFGINTVFFHTRPFSDSFYPSKIFPFSEYLTGKQGDEIDYDPLKIAVECAHERNMTFHAWINPFRISFSDDINKLSNSNPAVNLIKEKSNRVCTINDGLYYNPASEENHKLIIDGVREIVNNYSVDGIHIDDYFYPDTDEKIDKEQYDEYVKNGGKLSLEEWRIQTVNLFVSSLYSAVKSQNENVIFSISPAGNIENNYEKLYADVKRWGSTEGYCDWLIPQLYFDFENTTLPYEKAMNEWRENTTCKSVKLLSGLGAYRVIDGESDDWKSDDIIERQYKSAMDNGYDGIVLFSYQSLVSKEFGKNGDFLKTLN